MSLTPLTGFWYTVALDYGSSLLFTVDVFFLERHGDTVHSYMMRPSTSERFRMPYARSEPLKRDFEEKQEPVIREELQRTV